MKHLSKINHQLVIILIAIFSNFNVSCQSNSAELDNVLSTEYNAKGAGSSILVTKNGEVLYEKQYGLANLKSNSKVNNKTRFRIGSLTKQFTAAAILLLQERGKLKTSDYLGKYVKGFTTDKYPIKIEHLLTHTSGIKSGVPTKYKNKENSPEISPLEFASFLSESKLLFTPGEKYVYSNNGYIMLGLVIEAASGKPYKDFIEENIFKPLKMMNSVVAQKNNNIKNMATGYFKNDKDVLVEATEYTSSFSAGAIVSTPMDVAKWVNGLFNDKIISKTSRLEMLQNYKLSDGTETNMGYGWEINQIQEHSSFEHSGSEPGFKTKSIYIPNKKLYIIISQNTEEGTPTPSSINLASILIGKPYPNVENSIILNQEKRNKLVGTYLLKSNEERYIGFTNDFGFYYRASGGKKRKLYALNDSTLMFSRGYVTLKFRGSNETNGYRKFTYRNRIIKSTADKKSSEVPKDNKVIALASTVLKKYIGTYISKQFTMVISYEDNKLYAQPNGSDKLELKPKAENRFFIEEIGAEIEFNSNEKSDYINITLEGNVMQGIKK